MDRSILEHPERPAAPRHRALALGLIATLTAFTAGCLPQDSDDGTESDEDQAQQEAAEQSDDGDDDGHSDGEDDSNTEEEEASKDNEPDDEAESSDDEDSDADDTEDDTEDAEDPDNEDPGNEEPDTTDNADSPEGQQASADLEDSQLLMVMDASGSMEESDAGGTTRIEAAREALHSVVEGLGEQDEVGLRIFSSEVTDPEGQGACEDSELVVPIESGNGDALGEAIDSYEAVGGRTPLGHALEQAGEDLGQEGRRTIVLVSDGESNCEPDPCEVAETLASQGIDLTIHTVGYEVEDEARAELQCIAAAGDGEYYDAADADSLDRALERVSQRAFQPFTLSGDHVNGAEDASDAPTLQAGSQYVDEFTAEPLHYRIPREMDRSSLHVGLTTKNDPENSDFARIRLETEDGERCSEGRMLGESYSTRNFLRTAQAVTVPDSSLDEDPCTDDEELILVVEFYDEMNSELDSVGQAFELLIAEEPEAENAQDLPEEADFRTEPWQDMDRETDGAEPVVGGSSFNDATPLEPGTTYDGDILPGETLVFQVPVQWGERLQAEAYFEEPQGELRERVGSVGSIGLTAMSPLRGVIGSNVGYFPSTSSVEYQVTTPEVRWNNRDANNVTSEGANTSLDGHYYLVLAADESEDGDSFAIPFALTVDTFGEAGEGEPQRPSGEELLFPDLQSTEED